jgi:hypothetical protein
MTLSVCFRLLAVRSRVTECFYVYDTYTITANTWKVWHHGMRICRTFDDTVCVFESYCMPGSAYEVKFSTAECTMQAQIRRYFTCFKLKF